MTDKFKILAPTWNYLMDHILYQIFNIILKKHEEKTITPSIRIYVTI